MKDTKDMTDEELSEVLGSMGITVTNGMIKKIREEERADQGDAKRNSFELDATAVLTSEDWELEFETVRRQIDEDERLEGLNVVTPPQPPLWIIEDYINSRRQASGQGARTYREVCGGAKFTSQAETTALKPILLNDMQVGKRHHGRVLLCRTTTLPLHTNAIRVVILDTAGSGAILELFHYPLLPLSLGRPSRQDFDDAFDVDTVLAIKEPRLTLNSTLMTIRVESCTDVHELELGDPMVSGTRWVDSKGQQWERLPQGMGDATGTVSVREQLSKLSTARRYLKMEAILTRAVTNLSSDLPEWAGLLLDRARNRFVLERYHQALDDVRQAERILGAHTSIERDDSKKQLQSCQTIRARCLYALGRWKEAEEAYRMSENSAPPDAESSIVSELKHCRLRIQEQSTGRYNYAELFRQVHRDGIRRFDIAGWKGPIEVAQYAGMGRGYRTTREVKAGELLLVEKALSVVTRATASEISDSPRLTGFNLFTETIEGSRLHSLRMDLAYKAAHRPGLGQALRGLYDGSQSKSAETHSTAAASIDQATISDSRHIDGIVTYNVFTLRDLDYAAFADRVRSERGDQASALFERASMFNHSCMNNAFWISLGDVLFVRATEDLPAGTQVLINYCSNAEYLDRHLALGRFLGKAGCSCQLCEDDREDDEAAMTVRKDVLDSRLGRYYGQQALDANATRSALSARIANIKRDIAKVDASYSNRRVSNLRPGLFRLYLDLALHLSFASRRQGRQAREDARVSIAQYRLALASIGLTVDLTLPDPIVSLPRAFQQESIMCLLEIAGTLQSLGSKEDAIKWMTAAKQTHEKLVCESVNSAADLFAERFANVIKAIGLGHSLPI